jgi:hypothetical protein
VIALLLNSWVATSPLITQMISTDPVLTTWLLRLAIRPVPTGQQINSVSEALLGLPGPFAGLRRLALQTFRAWT